MNKRAKSGSFSINADAQSDAKEITKQIHELIRRAAIQGQKEEALLFNMENVILRYINKKLDEIDQLKSKLSQLESSPKFETLTSSAPTPAPPSSRPAYHFQRENVRALKILVPPPSGKMAICFSDIQSSAYLWDKCGNDMRTSLILHNRILRDLLSIYKGYEVKTEGDAFMVAFSDINQSLEWCRNAQLSLIEQEWPSEILSHPCSCRETDPAGNLIWNGLRVKMGINSGTPVGDIDPVTGRMDYFGPMVNLSARLVHMAHGGQIIVSKEIHDEATLQNFVVTPLGAQRFKGISTAVECFCLIPISLKSRGVQMPEQKPNFALSDWLEDETIRQQSAYQKLKSSIESFSGNKNLTTFPSKCSAMVVMEVQSSKSLWDSNPTACQAIILHYNSLVNQLVNVHGGSIVYNQADCFVLAFRSVLVAYLFSITLQDKLTQENWDEHESLPKVPAEGKALGYIWNGPRVKVYVSTTQEQNVDVISLDTIGNMLIKCVGGEITFNEYSNNILSPMLSPNNSRTKDVGIIKQLEQDLFVAVPKRLASRLTDRSTKCEPPQRLLEWISSQLHNYTNKIRRLQQAASLLDLDKDLESTLVAPQGWLTLLWTELPSLPSLWETFTEDMVSTLKLFTIEVRRLYRIYNGYEVRKTDGGGFLLAFTSPKKAIEFGLELHLSLMTQPWPNSILKVLPQSQPDVWYGPAARVAIHYGLPAVAWDHETGRVDYFGVTVERALEIFSLTKEGDMLVSHSVLEQVPDSSNLAVLTDLTIRISGDIKLFRLLPFKLQNRLIPTPIPNRRNTLVDEIITIDDLDNPRKKIENCIANLLPVYDQIGQDRNQLNSLMVDPNLTVKAKRTLSHLYSTSAVSLGLVQAALDTLHLLLSTPENIDRDFTPSPMLSQSSFASKLDLESRSVDSSSDENSDVEEFRQDDIRSKNVTLPERIIAIHRAIFQYFSLMRAFLEGLMPMQEDRFKGLGQPRKRLTAEEFISEWTKWTSANRHSLMTMDHRSKKKVREEFSALVVMAIEDQDSLILEDPGRISSSVIGHLCKNFNLIKRLLHKLAQVQKLKPPLVVNSSSDNFTMAQVEKPLSSPKHNQSFRNMPRKITSLAPLESIPTSTFSPLTSKSSFIDSSITKLPSRRNTTKDRLPEPY